jgi:hypothetical protein
MLFLCRDKEFQEIIYIFFYFKISIVIVTLKTETKRGKNTVQQDAEMQHYCAYGEAVNLSSSLAWLKLRHDVLY